MQIQEIEVVIGKSGNVQIHVMGIKGEQCLETTKALENALGGELISREPTSEASEQEKEISTYKLQQHF